MTSFIVLAVLMAAAAIAVIAWPFFKARHYEGRGALGMVALLTVAIPLGAFLLYRSWSNFSWDPAAMEAQGPAHEMQVAIAQLEARLQQNGSDVEGWMLLGRSYLMQNDFANATRAYQKAHELTGGQDADVTVNYAEALALADPGALTGRAGELFEAALKVDAQNQKGLWYGGLRALRANDPGLARERWTALVATNPPAEIRTILEQRIAELDQTVPAADRQAGQGATATVAPAAASPKAAPAIAAPAPAAPAGTPGRAVVRVSIAPALAAQLPPGAPMFVLARDPTQPGPPLAAQRVAGGSLPAQIELTDANAMSPGRTISTAKQLTIVARVSKTGVPMATSGDLYGEVTYDTANWAPMDLVIDKTVP